MIRQGKSMNLALALLVSASAGTLAIAAPASAQEQANFERYNNSGYTYCDAKLIGAAFGEDPWQGKLIIGQKIANGIGSNIPFMLDQSRQQGNACDWSDLPHSFDDAVALGNYWGVDTSQAKAKAASFYTGGQAGAVTDALRYGRSTGRVENKTAALDMFFASGFSYCDAKLVGAYFGQSPYEGKMFIGNKIKAGLIENIPWYLDRSRESKVGCDWSDLPYDYSDAERLSRMWNKSIDQTKSAVTQLVMAGRGDVVNASLGR